MSSISEIVRPEDVNVFVRGLDKRRRPIFTVFDQYIPLEVLEMCREE
jgi:hypothetical protein